MNFLNPGDKVWYTYYREAIIVPAVVVETNDVYGGNPNGTIWHNRFIDQPSTVHYPTEQKDENGWNIWEDMPEFELSKYQRVNQFLWLDEYTYGHEIQLATLDPDRFDPYDGCFLTLAEAMRYVPASNKKHLRRRLKMARGKAQRFIAQTWEMSGDGIAHAGFGKMPDKKVYVRKK